MGVPGRAQPVWAVAAVAPRIRRAVVDPPDPVGLHRSPERVVQIVTHNQVRPFGRLAPAYPISDPVHARTTPPGD